MANPRSPFLLLLLLLLTCAAAAIPTRLHNVGGKLRWAPNVNYTTWAAGERFVIGDWLVFLYEKGYYDVVQVNATDFDRCSADHPILSYSKGRSFAFQLNRTGDFYFLCSRGYCWSGMKLAVHVDPPPSLLSPSPSLLPSSAPARRVASLSAAAAAIAFAGQLLL